MVDLSPQLLDEVRKLFCKILVDCSNLRHLVFVVLMVRQAMVAFGDANHWIGRIAAFVTKHESRNASRISLKGQYHQVVHQPNVLAYVGRLFGRMSQIRVQIDWLGKSLNTLLDVANAGEILIQYNIFLFCTTGHSR